MPTQSVIILLQHCQRNHGQGRLTPSPFKSEGDCSPKRPWIDTPMATAIGNIHENLVKCRHMVFEIRTHGQANSQTRWHNPNYIASFWGEVNQTTLKIEENRLTIMLIKSLKARLRKVLGEQAASSPTLVADPFSCCTQSFNRICQEAPMCTSI